MGKPHRSRIRRSRGSTSPVLTPPETVSEELEPVAPVTEADITIEEIKKGLAKLAPGELLCLKGRCVKLDPEKSLAKQLTRAEFTRIDWSGVDLRYVRLGTIPWNDFKIDNNTKFSDELDDPIKQKIANRINLSKGVRGV